MAGESARVSSCPKRRSATIWTTTAMEIRMRPVVPVWIQMEMDITHSIVRIADAPTGPIVMIRTSLFIPVLLRYVTV
jgi:hypothetical protein